MKQRLIYKIISVEVLYFIFIIEVKRYWTFPDINMYCTKARGTRLSMFSRYSMCTCVNRCQKITILDMVFYHDTNVELLHRVRITGWILNVRPCDNCSDVIDIGLFSNSFTLCLNVVYQKITLVRFFIWFYKNGHNVREKMVC